VGENVKADDWGGGNGGAGDDVSGAIRDVKEGIIFWVVKDGPGEFGGWGTWGGNNG